MLRRGVARGTGTLYISGVLIRGNDAVGVLSTAIPDVKTYITLLMDRKVMGESICGLTSLSFLRTDVLAPVSLSIVLWVVVCLSAAPEAAAP